MRAMKNYAGHRLAPWLSHVMVSRQETARQLLTPGEVMQLPSDDEIILVSGVPPIRATKIRYYADKNFKSRVSPAPILNGPDHPYGDCPPPRRDDWGRMNANVHDNLLEVFKAELVDKVESSDGSKERKIDVEKQTEPKADQDHESLISFGDVDLDEQYETVATNTIARDTDIVDRATPGQDFAGLSR